MKQLCPVTEKDCVRSCEQICRNYCNGKAAPIRGAATVRVGDKFQRPTDPPTIGHIRIMAIAEGYALCRRYKGGTFAENVKDIAARWIRVD